jgi:DNA-binding CsgD family transcriptional regulator/tetratricopeptide (TPR) repeat protein
MVAREGFVGRDQEVSVLRAALADVLRGRGRALLIEGEPGIGKSALLEAVFGEPEPGGDRDSGQGDLGDVGVELVRGGCDEWGRRYALTAVISALGAVPDVPEPPPPLALAAGAVPRSVAGDAVMAAVDALLLIVEKLCARRPVVFVLEDLHWADEATLMFWRELSARVDRLPLLLVGTRRPVPHRALLDRLREELAGSGGLVLTLDRLPRRAVAELAERLRGTPAPPRLLALLEAARGNPLCIGELLDALTRLGVQEPPELPASLSDMVGDWLDPLAPGSRDVLRGAAVLGDGFAGGELAVLLDRPAEEISALLKGAVAAGLLEVGDGDLRFRHELIRRSLYEAIPVGLRIALHRYIAKILIGLAARPERIARQLLAGRDETERWEVDWLIEHAKAVYASEPEIATELVGEVLRGIDPADPRHAALEDRWAMFSLRLDRFEQAARIGRGILTRTDDPARMGPAVWIVTLSLMVMSRFDEALTLLDKASTRAGIAPLWRARHEAVRAVVLQIRGRPDEGRAAADRALAIELEPEDPFATSIALYLRSVTRAAGRDLAGALEDVDRALDASLREADLADVRMLLLGNRYAYRFAIGRHAGVPHAMHQVLAMAERIDSPWLLRVRRQAAELLFELGHWTEASAQLRPEPQQILRYAIGALIAAHRDDSDEVARQLKALEAVQDAAGVTSPHSASSLHLHAVAARALECERGGLPAEAVAVLSVCLEPGAEDLLPGRHVLLPALVRLASAAEDPVMAQAAAEAADWEVAREPTPRKQAVAGWCHGLLAEEPAPILLASFHFRHAGLRLDRGNALEDAAELYARAGRTERARSALRDSLAVYEELGATWDARRAASRLRAYDVRLGVRGSRARPGDGGRSLTSTERRVAELAADGCSNMDIAARMFLSRRTVETHMSSILAKLQISSRREVRERLAKDEP